MGKRRWPEGQRGLTDRQQRFVEEYMVDLNCARAARRAGYSPRSVNPQATLMGTPHVRAAIEARLADRAERSRIDAERVIAELGRLAFSNILDYLALDDDTGGPRIDLAALSREHGAAIQSITVDYYRPQRPRKSRAKTPPPHKPCAANDEAEALAEQGPAMGEVRRVRITLADKRTALVELARHLGMRAPYADGDYENHPAIIQVVTGVPRPGDPDVIEMRRLEQERAGD